MQPPNLSGPAADPTQAVAGSLRRQILDNWKELGLQSEPNVGDNGVHASASPFEALAERMNWVGHRGFFHSQAFGLLFFLIKTHIHTGEGRSLVFFLNFRPVLL